MTKIFEGTCCHIYSPSRIYVWFEHQNTKRVHFMNKLNIYYTNNNYFHIHSEGNWVAGAWCALSTPDGWQRARVVKTYLNSDYITVFYIDTGASATVEPHRLYTLLRFFQKVSAYAVRCHLAEAAPTCNHTWAHLSIEYLSVILKKNTKLEVEVMGQLVRGSMPVALWLRHRIYGGPVDPHRWEKRNVAHKLIFEGVAISRSPAIEYYKPLDEVDLSQNPTESVQRWMVGVEISVSETSYRVPARRMPVAKAHVVSRLDPPKPKFYKLSRVSRNQRFAPLTLAVAQRSEYWALHFGDYFEFC